MKRLNRQIQNVYAEHGCVMGEAQLLERYLAYMIVGGREQPTSQDFNQELRDIAKKSLGDLIRIFKRSFPVPPSLEARLDAVKRLRNVVAHDYFSLRAEAFQTRGGRAEMIRELDQIGDQFHKLYEYLDDLVVGWLAGPDPTRMELIETFVRTARRLTGA